MSGAATELLRRRLSRGRALWTLLRRTNSPLPLVVGILTLVSSMTPIGIMLSSGSLVRTAPLVVDAGLSSIAGTKTLVALGLVGVLLVVQGVTEAFASHYARVLDSICARTLHEATARATLRTPGIAELEDFDVANEIASIEEFEQADRFFAIASNLRELLRQRTVGLGAVAILATYAWWAPLLLFAGWRLVNHFMTRLVERGLNMGFGTAAAANLRRAQYLRSLLVEAPMSKEIRIFGLADWLADLYTRSWTHAMNAIWRNRFSSSLRLLSAVGALVVAYAIVLGRLAWAVDGALLSVDRMIVLVQAAIAMASFGWQGDIQWATSRALDTAARIIKLESRLTAVPLPATLPAASGGAVAVSIRDVRFTYPGQSTPTLDGPTLEIPAGQTIAVVGNNGAGKSTLIKLLCGLYLPDSGYISLSGAPPRLARSRIGAIFQNFTRYELSLRANVGFGRLASMNDPAALENALRDSGLDELVGKLPRGLDTVLGRGYEHGTDLSGGEWQKVALARALMATHAGAGLLILDEPTSSLDVRAEVDLFERLMGLDGQRTTILVSHRLASVRNADRIVVLSEGRITEDGTHEDLIGLGGQYAEMFALQAERFSDLTADAAGGA